ncbi:MAG TPA: TatD family hydrolase [Candidatus Binatia bacterium]|jgi:TatD DNase family protein
MLIDAHAHIDKHGAELDAALEQIEERRILTWAVAMDVPSYLRTLDIAERCEWVKPTFGIHPNRAHEYADNLKALAPLIEQSPALGELGLDFHWVKEPEKYPAQKKVLEYFLAAAREQDKVVNLHTKGAEREILDLLERYAIRRALVHWYSGTEDILRALIDYGAYFTFGVELLTSDKIRALARAVPLDRIITETDNPGGLKWLTGEVGMPEVLTRVVEELGRVKGMKAEEMERRVEENFRRMMGAQML